MTEARLLWRLKAPWLSLYVMLALAAAVLTVWAAYQVAHPALAALSASNVDVLAVLGSWQQAERVWTWLVLEGYLIPAQAGATVLLLLLTIGLFARSLYAGSDTFAHELIRSRVEDDPWRVRRWVPLNLPEAYGQFWATRQDVLDLLRPPSAKAAGKKHHYGCWGRRPMAAYPGWDGKTEMENALIVAPPGSGKGMLIKANLTMWRGSAVIADLKGDLYRDLGGALTRVGHRCFVLRTDGLGHGYDPFAEFQGELGLSAAAAILLSPEHDSGHKIFGERAAIILSAMMLAARAQAKPILPYLKTLLANGMERCLKELQALADPVIDRKITSFLSEPADLTDWESVLQDRFIQSCWANLTTRVELLLADSILAVTSRSDFTAATLREGRTKVFLQFSREHLEATLPLYRLIVESLTRGLTRSDEILPGFQETPVWFIHDEAHLLTPTNLPEHLNSVRDWGVVMWVVLQSRAQLRERYGHDNASTIEAGCGVQIYYRPNDHATAENLSERLGEMPVPRESRGERGRLGDKSVNTTLATQPLLRPRSISQLKAWQTIVLARGRPPIAARRIWPTDLSGGKQVFVKRHGRLLPRYPAPELPRLSLPVISKPTPKVHVKAQKREKDDRAAKSALEKVRSMRRSSS